MHDIYTEITQRIITALEAGTPPWVRPWSGDADPTPTNAETRRTYRGVNFLTLTIEAQAHGYNRNRWLTYRQAAALGAQVRKGERGTPVVFWRLREIDADDNPRVVPLLRRYSVFNTAQIDGLPPALAEPLPSAPDWAGDEVAETLIEASDADIRHAGFRAYYQPGDDYIQIPPRAAFDNSAGYYATTLHELVHWTAHPLRLNRQLSGRFGDEGYAAEELIAELGSAFLCAHCRIDGQLQHAAYIGNWLKVLRNDKRAIFVAGTKAQHAADFLLACCTETTGSEALAARS